MSNKITEEEIIDFYKTNHGIIIRKEDLLRPCKEFVLSLYTRILEDLDVHNLNQADILAMTNMTENMEEAYWSINVYKVANHCVKSVGLKLMDILQPKRARTIRVLHALATYSVRYNTIKAEWFEFAEKYHNLNQKKKELEKRKLESKHAIESKSMLLSSLKNKSVGLEKEMDSLGECFHKEKSEADKEEKKASEIKSEIMTLKGQLCDIKLEVSKLEESNKKLSQTIVNSPMKIIKSKNLLENKLASISEEYSVLKSQQNDLQKKKTCISNSQTDMIDVIKELKELFELLPKIEYDCNELEGIIKDTAHLDEDMKQMEIQKKNIEMSIQSLKTKMDKENGKYIRQKKVLEELLEGLQGKVKANEELFGKMKNSNSTYLNRLQELKDETEKFSLHEKELCRRQEQTHRNNLQKILELFKNIENFK